MDRMNRAPLSQRIEAVKSHIESLLDRADPATGSQGAGAEILQEISALVEELQAIGEEWGRQREELESLKNDYNSLQFKTDSLSQIIQQVKGRQREMDLLQERFSKLLLGACEELKQAIAMLPPGNTQSHLSALAFLQSELSVKAVDNTEALERLWQILSALSENSQSINIFPGQSPVSFISGQVDFIRIGYAYLAIVNEKGTAGALWIPSADSSFGNWVENKNPQQLLVD